jgi:FkbM family methyltransferase
MSVIRSQPNRAELFDFYGRIWRALGRSQVARTNFGARIRCDLGDLIPSRIFHFGFWEPNLSSYLWKTLSAGDVFIDVGANIGYYSLLGAKRVGDTGSIVAIEASPRIFARLQHNLEANAATNVRAVNLAVSGAAGTATIYAGPAQNSGATSTLRGWRNGTPEAQVAALPLDRILTESERSRTALIKIDVEGAEMPILQQLLSSLERYPRCIAIIVECNPANDDLRLVLDRFDAKGFQAYEVLNRYDAAWYLDWREPAEVHRLQGFTTAQADILLCRESAGRCAR